ncbi:hypothetical protein HU200_009656 [Digitaria exilis]|uniref:Beta-glucosidase n=1 Tax=Digitaria exilis TaxID=1010633 RepID=A0A835KP63_9POAL|nr:hypothetical protein HU200_009656 [Digitaria exilis]
MHRILHRAILIYCYTDIEPYVTIFHWDTPQALEEEYKGFLSPRIVKDYTDFAKVCFEHFGDEVKNWFTFNEPHMFCTFAYGMGEHAPGRCSPELQCAIPCGDSLREPYLVGHHILLAHAEVASLYKDNYKCYEPYNEKTFLDKQAKERSIEFNLGWFMEPVFHGDYPFSMRALVGHRLPHFKDDEKEKLKHSYDMMGINYYTSMTGTGWIRSYPKGLKELLMIMKDRYGNPPMYITENGTADYDDGNLSMKDALNDCIRLDYLQRHISVLKESIDSGADVRGHFTWSLLDNFEWALGYTSRFGLIYVDRNDGFKRYMKRSARWFKEFNSARGKMTDEDNADTVHEPSLLISNN